MARIKEGKSARKIETRAQPDRRGKDVSLGLSRLAAPASMAAGLLWLLVWFHQRQTHGPTSVNERGVLLGLTWLDSAKFLVVPLILVLIGIAVLYGLRERPGPLGRIGFVVTVVGLVGLIVGTAFEFWFHPWGSYAVSPASGLPRWGGLFQGLSTLVFTIGLIPFNIDLVRGRVMPVWVAPIVVLGGLTTFWLGPAGWLPGVAWLLLGFVLWSQRERQPSDSRQ